MAWRRLARNAYPNVKYVLFSFPSKLISKESIKLFTFFRFMLIKKHKNVWLAMEILSFGLFAPTGSLWVAFGFHRLGKVSFPILTVLSFCQSGLHQLMTSFALASRYIQ